MQSSKDFSKSHFLNIPLICLQSQIISDNMTSTWYEALKALRSNGANTKTILKTTRSPAIWNPIGLTSLSVAIDITLSSNLAKNLLPHIFLFQRGRSPFLSFDICSVFCLIVLNTFPTSGPHPCLSRPPVVGTLLYGNEPQCSSEQAFYPELRGNEYIWTVFPLSYCARAPRWEI